MKPLADHHRAATAFLQGPPAYWREAALCTPAMPLILIVGFATDNVAYGAVAAGAALMVGFGAARDLRGMRWAALIAATLSTTATAFIGCLAGQWLPALLIVSAIAAAICAVLALIDEDFWWVSLQTVVALLVAGYYAGPPHVALIRAAVVLAGGATQVVIVMILATVFPNAANPLPAAARKAPSPRGLFVSHAIRAAICVAVSLALAHALGLTNSYWAPMTAMLVLKPGLSETQTRGVARLTGTVAGCIGASLFALATGYSHYWLLGGVALTAGAAFALQKAHYAILSATVTSTVVLLLSLAQGGYVLLNSEHRLIATLLGGAVALLVARIAPHRPSLAQPGVDRVGRAGGAPERAAG